ncbi:MAG: DNA recombination protein RmuC [Actinomycetota bacterium]|nr:DNA recombination protein RmuC [Actinomycetota bacterium]
MDTVVVAMLGLIAGALFALAAVRRAGAGVDPRLQRTESLTAEVASVAEQVEHLSRRVSEDTSLLAQRLEGIDSRMTSTQVASQHLAQDIFGTLGDVQRATESVAEQARQFASLQDLLKAPKARGGLGEALLEELLRQVLPPQAFACQHRFSSGLVVDAIVKAGGRKICIDSKFPLTNYQAMCDAGDAAGRALAERAFAADVEKHIKDISSRYIVPAEDTLDFAVMYVPAEGIYAEVLRLAHRKRPLFETAIECRVVPMSPLTMYSYLQTILFGLKCLKIEESAERILDQCGRLHQGMTRFVDDYDTLGKHLGNAYAKYGDATRRLDRLRGDLDRVVDFAEEGPDDSRPSLEVIASD